MNTSGRKRKQAVGGYKNLPPRQRPHYNAISAEKSAARERRKAETAQRLQQKKKSA